MPREPREPKPRKKSGLSGSPQQSVFRRALRGNNLEPVWSGADAKLLHRLISVVTSLGGAVQFGLTREHDQYVLRFWGNGEADVVYLRPTEDLDTWLEYLCATFEEFGDTGASGGDGG